MNHPENRRIAAPGHDSLSLEKEMELDYPAGTGLFPTNRVPHSEHRNYGGSVCNTTDGRFIPLSANAYTIISTIV